MVAVASWWLVLEVLGLVALPIALRLFRHLPERGYAFAKPLGLLLTGYLLWIGASFGFLSNTRTAMWFVMLLVGLASAWLWRRDREGMASSLRENWRVIVATEIVFAVFFVGWAFVRAHNPAIDSTEKPMEIAFLNAILGSERFPPYDPWMSGFGISYYYMGYLLVAVLTRLSGVIPSVGFNLAISSLFALTATGSFSLVYNLWASDQRERLRERLSGIAWALLGPLFVVVIGNLEGLFEVLHSRGLGSRAFWEWMDLHGLQDVQVSGRWIPSDNWWWWRASRVVNDKDLRGLHMEVIDEFPQFSFLLGDMHPHVLDLPFVLLAIALALNIVLGARSWPRDTESGSGLRALPAAVWQLLRGMWQDHGFEMLMLAFCLGSLGFINTWDLPIYLVVVIGAFLVGQRMQQRADWLPSTVAFALSVAVPGVLLYLPFYLTFQSQAGGVLPSLFNHTRVQQYLVMFGLFVFVIGSLVVVQLVRAFKQAGDRRGFWWDLINVLMWLVAGPVLVMVLAMGMVVATPSGKQFLQGLLADSEVQELIGSTGVMGLLRQAVLVRLANPWTSLLLAVLIAGLVSAVLRSWKRETKETGVALVFANWIAGVGLLLTLGTEYVYLRDTFGTRMNTIFKFYYQAWVMMGIAAAYGSYHMLGRGRRAAATSDEAAPGAWAGGAGRYVWGGVLAVLVLASLIYPALAIPNKTGFFRGEATLDGMAFLKYARADDLAAILWLRTKVAVPTHIVEATGGSFSDHGFVSAFTGLPTVLGWGGHELQWRGNYDEPGKREPDIAQIYQSRDTQQVLTLLDKYDIRYVYLGSIERRRYELPANVGDRFSQFLEKVYEQGGVQIFAR